MSSTRRAEQAQDALQTLLGGFMAADAATGGRLLGDLSREAPRHILDGLLTTLLRLVFLHHAEHRGRLSGELTDLHARLRADAERGAAAMEQRFDAWATLLARFRRVHGGEPGRHEPARAGRLFDPEQFPFLEGRARHEPWSPAGERPRVPDGAVLRVLTALLDDRDDDDDEHDDEHLGAVHEALLGLTLARARGPGVAVRPRHVVVDLDELLSQKPGERGEHLRRIAGCELGAPAQGALAAARTPADVLAALGHRLSPRTPTLVPAGALHLQTGEQRRSSGAHYTPRGLTAGIVRTALQPLLAALGERPTSAQLLGLKLCDPAMGSGAFLIEAARQLGEHLLRAWATHDRPPPIPAGEDLTRFARRQIAGSCLFGVDSNALAVELARLSLWSIAGLKDDPFTFLDHALKHGDSLVGVDHQAIAALRPDLDLAGARIVGDALVHAHFSATSESHRQRSREALARALAGDAPPDLRALAAAGAALRGGERPLHPFHWTLEFPAVFERDNPGFDCFVGNPPFLGGTRLSTVAGMAYFAWLLRRHPGTGHLCDLVAHFLRLAFALLRRSGTLGFVATNTVAQGDTRLGGLAWIAAHGGVLYAAQRRLRWPGSAAVVVSIVHIHNGPTAAPRTLDGRPVAHISSYLLDSAHEGTPERLPGAAALFSLGSKIYGQGFLFADDDPEATPLATLAALQRADPGSRARVLPYIGGHEVNQSPTQAPARHAIYLSDLDTEAELQAWPALAAIVRARVKPGRDRLGDNPNNTPLKRRWWAYQAHRPALYAAIRDLRRVLVLSRMSRSLAFTFLPPDYIYSEQLVVFTYDTFAAFAVLQSRVHELWARAFSSSMRDDLRYTPSDCFETFPFPHDWQRDPALESAGQRYHETRAALLLRCDHGLTTAYNRFNDPDERAPDIASLRELHAEIDRAVLAAYGWTDLATNLTCEFRLDLEHDARRRPWRLRWPQHVHDEVLARLLDLNQRRAAAR